MARYTSNRFKDIVIGLPNYSEEKTALEVVGKVGIGTNDAKTPLWIEGNTNIAGIITATTFKKEGGTNSQFLMADGSTNNLTYLTTETSTLDEILGRGNSTTKSLKVGISTFSGEINVGSGNSVSIGHSSPKALVDIRFNKLTDEGDAFNDSGNENFGGWRDAGLDIVRLENTGLDLGSGSLAVPEGKDVHTLVHFVSHWTDWWVGSKNVDSSNKGTFAIYYDGPGGAGLTDDGKPREVFIIDENQNVGIGTIDPSTAAHSGNDKVLNVGIVTANYLYGSLTGNSTGLSGSPNINVGILNASSGTVNGNFEVTGELTYADVTDVDSIGLVTARSGIHVGPITAGVATVSTDGNASFTGIVTATSFSVTGAAAGAVLMADGTTNALNAEKLIDANDATRVEANIHGAFVSGILTATSFSGALTGDVTGDTSGSSGSCTGNSLTATDLSINATNRLLYQSANNSTDIMVEGNSGQVLQSNGDGNVPTWVDAAPSSAISGLTLRQDGDQVGDASGVSQINFVGAAVTFTSTAGLGTVTIQTESVSSVIMSMIF